MRDEDRETLTEHRQRLERIEHGVGEILAVQEQHGEILTAQGERLDRLETKVDALGEVLHQVLNMLGEQGKVLIKHGEALSSLLKH